MPLESLDNQINIHDLTLEQEKKPISESKIIFENLLQSNFHDDRNLWRDIDVTVDIPWENGINVKNQFFGIMTEGLFDPSGARKHLSVLKNLSFHKEYQKSDSQNWEIWREKDNNNKSFMVDDQLLGIIVEYLFGDKKESKSQYDILSESQMYDREQNMWYFGIDSNSNFNKSYFTSAQLLNVLYLSFTDTEKAKTQFDLIKNDFQNKDGSWKPYNTHWESFVTDQLLGVLVEAKFDKTSARKKYDELKTTKFYDDSTKQWLINYFIRNPNLRSSTDQLLGVLCEHEFEEHEPNLQTSIPALPETRKY